MEDEKNLEEGLLDPQGGRNAMERIALIAIFDALTQIAMKQPVNVEEIISSLSEMPYEDCDPFVKEALIKTLAHYHEEVEVFNANMRKWTFDRLNRVEQAILLLAYTHRFFMEEKSDKAVIIDVAIKQAKTYLEPKDAKFVNAILDNVLA